ncbi:MAG: thioredoxin family protein [Roseiflexaceae bacterium]
MFRRIAIAPLLAVLLASCGQAAAPAGAPAAQGSPPPAAQSGAVTPLFAFSEAVVGRNRIAIGLLRGGTPVNDPAAKVHLRFFDLDDQSAQVKFEADARYFGQGLPAGFYVAYPTFDTAGNWGIEVQTQLPGQAQPSASRLRLEVKPKSDVPNDGQPAIAVKTPTVTDTSDLSRLSSGTPVNPAMYQISLDAALKSGKPTALLFATPAFCASATCGPSLQVLEGLQKTYGDRMNFIHVEVYKYPFGESAGKGDLSAPMVAWGLKSEPWLFLIDAKGTIGARFEGGITREELGPALEKLIAGQAVVVGS